MAASATGNKGSNLAERVLNLADTDCIVVPFRDGPGSTWRRSAVARSARAGAWHRDAWTLVRYQDVPPVAKS